MERISLARQLKACKRLPFEDGVFNSIYRAVLLRNVEFCKVITNEDRASCIRMTNKFIHQAILVAYGVNNEEISIKELVKNIEIEDSVKCYRKIF